MYEALLQSDLFHHEIMFLSHRCFLKALFEMFEYDIEKISITSDDKLVMVDGLVFCFLNKNNMDFKYSYFIFDDIDQFFR